MQAAVADPLRRRRVDPRALLPSGPSLVVGFALLALGLGSFLVARHTSLFAIERIEVAGGSADVRARVRSALDGLEGRSLVGLEAADLDRRIAALPDVVGVTHDRAFPHTLRVVVLPERPLLVLRRGEESWLVSARGRVVRQVARGALPRLPRLWVAREVEVAAGDTVADPVARRTVRALALARTALPARVHVVKPTGRDTTLVLRSGLELRLGRAEHLALKLAVAAAILPRVGAGATYLDVAVPERPVADGGG